MKPIATLALLVMTSMAWTGVAAAQDAAAPPAGTQRCGGLVCDLGLFGFGKSGADAAATALPCNDFFCRALGGGRTADAAPPPPPPMAAPEEPMKPKHAMHRRKHVAKAEAPPQ